MKKLIKTALFLLVASVSLSVAATEELPPKPSEEGFVDTATDEMNPADTAEDEGEFNAMHCGRGRGGWGSGGWGGGGCGGGGGWGGGGWGHHRRYW